MAPKTAANHPPAATGEPVTERSKIRVLELGVSLCIGGSERLAASIGQGLDPERFEVFFAAIGNDGDIGQQLRERGFVTAAFQRRDGFDRQLFRKIWHSIRTHRVDIVQSHHLSSLIYGGFPTRLAGAKLVHTEHEIKTFERPRNVRWLRTLQHLVHRFVAIDDSIAQFLHDRAKIAKDRIVVIPNGIDLQRFHPAPAREKEQFVVGWVGRLDPPKRPDVFVEAIGLVRQKLPHVHGILIGPGILADSVRSRIVELGLSDYVAMLGGRSDIPELLQTMDCFVLCSDAEGLPISLVEAMASGLPCIASGVGAIPKVLQDGANGLVLEENNPSILAAKLENIVQNAAFRAKLGSAAREASIARFDLRSTVEQYSKLFSELMKSRDAASR